MRGRGREGEKGYLSQGRSADLIWLQYLATTILYYIKKNKKKTKRIKEILSLTSSLNL